MLGVWVEVSRAMSTETREERGEEKKKESFSLDFRVLVVKN